MSTPDEAERRAWAYLSAVAEPPCAPLIALVARHGAVETARMVKAQSLPAGHAAVRTATAARAAVDRGAADLDTAARLGARLVTRDDDAETFIQAAGSAEAMTVEARLRGEDGDHHLYTIGRRQAADAGTEETVLVPIGPDRSVRVLLREIFTADEAAEIFAAFVRTDTVPDAYARRELDLSVAQSEPR